MYLFSKNFNITSNFQGILEPQDVITSSTTLNDPDDKSAEAIRTTYEYEWVDNWYADITHISIMSHLTMQNCHSGFPRGLGASFGQCGNYKSSKR